jgi:hypothetical protein
LSPRRAPDFTEAEFMRQVTDLATMLGWSWAHFRPARTSHGWRVPVSGPLGAGWPDLTLVRDDRLIFAELKRSSSHRPSPDQVFALELLGAAAETYVWRPSDIDEIALVLGSPRPPKTVT